MTEHGQERGPDHDGDDAALKALLGRARRYPASAAAARDRAFAAVHAEWRAGLQAPAAPAAPDVAAAPAASRPRRRFASFALAAGVAVLSVAGALAFRAQQPAGPTVAVAQAVAGQATLERAWWRGVDRPLAAAAQVAAGDRVVTSPDSVAGLQLSASLAVRVAPGSRLRFDAPDAATLESGTVYVDSDPRRGRTALRIRTPYGVVSHLGTQYTVGLADGALEVAVREGEVALQQGAAMQRARGGELLRVDAGGAVSREPLAPHGERWAWLVRAPAAVAIDGRPLADFLYWYSRETGVEPRFADADAGSRLGGMILHGDVAGLAPDDALAVVAASVGLDVRRGEGDVTLAAR
jgi:ferric-dicitrate binding protein FerR (iron transport regulator)